MIVPTGELENAEMTPFGSHGARHFVPGTAISSDQFEDVEIAPSSNECGGVLITRTTV